MCVFAFKSRGGRNVSGRGFPRLWSAAVLICVFVNISALDAAPKPKPKILSISTTSLPSGTVGTAFSATLTATGGTTPYKWSLTSGTLPAGLSLSTAGPISGTPTAPANAASLTFKVTDSGRPVQSKSVTLTLTITPPALVVTTASLPGGQVGSAYTANLGASGGTAPYRWSLSGGTLPGGLSLSTSGVISGTPTTAQNVTGLSFLVTDSSAPSRTAQTGSLSITINAASGVTIVPKRAGLTVTEHLSLRATSGDGGSVNWSATGSGCSGASCGTFSSQSTARRITCDLHGSCNCGADHHHCHQREQCCFIVVCDCGSY